MSAQLSIGNEIKDSFKETHKWVQNNVKWLRDVEGFYRERSKLEKEYSEKLSHLTKEYFSKKSAATVALSVGDSPTTTPGSLEAASVVAWNEILTQTEMISKDHNELARQFDAQIGNQLAGVFTKLDMVLTRLEAFNGEITDKKTHAYHELEKAKKDYDEACSAMEAARNKHSKSPNDRNKKKLHERETEMNIAKNDYLIKINQANRIKDKYYFQDVPEVIDLLQDFNEARTVFLNEIWIEAGACEIKTGDSIKKRIETAASVIGENKPSLNTAMFIKHNTKQWKEPADFVFKPSPVWHDDETFVLPTQAEVKDLRIKLAQSEKDYDKYHEMAQSELSDLTALNTRKQKLKSSETTCRGQEYYDILKKYMGIVSPFTQHETNKLLAEVRIESIQNNVPEDVDLSTDGIDLNKVKRKAGLFTKLKHGLLSGNDSNNNTKNDRPARSMSRLSAFSGGASQRTTVSQDVEDDIQSVHTSTSTQLSDTMGHNKVLYAYTKQDTDEISVTPGDSITLVSKDTGSGWTKIANDTTGETGLVPTTYIQITESKPRAPPPRVPPSRRATVGIRIVTALYDYQAQGEDELSIQAGATVTVLKNDDGNGWTYGKLGDNKGLFPTSYCQ